MKNEDILLEEIIKTLASMDEDLHPSPQFRSNLMAKIRAEQAEIQYQSANTALQKEEDKMAEKSTVWQKIKESFGKNKFRVWLPAAVGLCLLTVVLTIGLNPDYLMNKSTVDMAASSEPELYQNNSYSGSAGMAGAGIVEEEGIAGQSIVKYDIVDQSNVMSPLPPDGGSVAPEEMEQKIIYTGSLGLEVDSYEETVSKIKQAVETTGGYLVYENRYSVDDKGRLAGDMTLRIPYQHFDSMLQQAGSLGKVTHQSTNARDVTTEFVDVQARLKVMEAKESRLLDLLKQTGSLSDLLAVEQELANTRAELESLKGQLRYLTNQTDYSTLNVHVMEKPLAASEIQTEGLKGLGKRIKEAFMLGVNGLLSFLGNLVVTFVGLLPALALGAVVLYFLWKKWLKNLWLKWRKPSG